MRQLPLSGTVTFALSARMALDAHRIRDLQDTRRAPTPDADDAPLGRILVNAVISGFIFLWLMLALHR